MAAQSLNPWIADLIREEINAVLAWQTSKYDNIKVEEDGRFDNDGSNLRSVVNQTEPGRGEVQLIEVLGPPDPSGVKVVISDGHTQLKARLSGSVVDILEAELDEKLSIDTTNDVFRLKRFVVVTTAIGSEDEWVQFTVEEIEYLYHRRRTIGQPTPIEQDSHLRSLIVDRVTSMLERHLMTEGEQPDWQSQDAQTDIEAVTVAVQRSSPTISRPLEAAAALRKRPQSGHTLERDGFEAQGGVNLQGPVQASRTNLLQLLTKSKPQPEVVAETPAKRIGRGESIRGHRLSDGAVAAVAEASGAESAEASPERMDTDSSPGRSELQRSSPPQRGSPQLSIPQSETTRPYRPPLDATRPSIARPSISQFSSERPSSPRPSAPVDNTVVPTQPESKRPTRGKPRIPYGRLKIPANQQALLDVGSSWLPSLPGHSFPKPNVPIELLTKWNTAPLPSQKSAAGSGRINASPSLEIRPSEGSQRKARCSSMSISEKSDDLDNSDEMVSSSAWPPSQPTPRSRPRARPDVPPDSSPTANVVRGTPNELEVEPPRVLKTHNSAQRAVAREQVPTWHSSDGGHGGDAMQRASARQQSTQRHPLPARPPGPPPGEIDAMPTSQQSSWMNRSPHVRPRAQPYSRVSQASAGLPSESNRQRTSPTGPHRPATPNGHRATAPPVAPRSGSSTWISGDASRASVPVDQASRSLQDAPSTPLPPRESIRHRKTEWREQYRKQEERLKAGQTNPGNQLMREFASSYINIRPGGAFATNDIPQPQQHLPVDILAWNDT